MLGIGIGISPMFRRGGQSLNAWTTLMNKFVNIGSPSGKVLFASYYSSAWQRGVIIEIGETNLIYFPLGLQSTFAAGQDVPEFKGYYNYKLIGGVGRADMILSGTWSNNASVYHYSGGYRANATVGGYAQCVTPEGVTEIGLYDVIGAPSGVALVSINGDNTLANDLYTAQEFVDNGWLAATALVEGGGTLNPTDRVYTYSRVKTVSTLGLVIPASSRRVRIATGLAAGSYTVRATVTGYIPQGESSANVRLAGFWFDDPAVDLSDYPIAMPVPQTTDLLSVAAGYSDNNFAFNFLPDGETGYEWMGHTGSQKVTTISVEVDDTARNPIDAPDYWLGDKVELIVTGYCRHTETGATNVIEYTQTFKFEAANWITSNLAITWKVPGTVSAGYTPMLAVNNNLDRGSMLDATQDYTLTDNDGSSKGGINSHIAYCWDANGRWAALTAIKSDETARYIQIEDRADGVANKMYLRRYNNATVAAEETESFESYYRFAFFADADAELAR